MCGRIARPDLTWAQIYALQREFVGGMDIERNNEAIDLAPSWNVKPTNLVDITYIQDGHLHSSTARWWFVPHFFDGDAREWKQTTFNARIETADQKPSFRTAWTHNRCIIPALGYYEWTGHKGAKQPWWMSTQRNTPLMYFAGLYSQMQSGGHSCTILTRPALPQIKEIHSRSPVILSEEQVLPWMSGKIETQDAQANLGTDWDGRMEFYEVNPFGIRDDGPALIEPITRLI